MIEMKGRKTYICIRRPPFDEPNLSCTHHGWFTAYCAAPDGNDDRERGKVDRAEDALKNYARWCMGGRV